MNTLVNTWSGDLFALLGVHSGANVQNDFTL